MTRVRAAAAAALAAAAWAVAPSSARAQAAPAAAASTGAAPAPKPAPIRRPVRPPPPTDNEPVAPLPDVRLTVDAPSARGAWTMRVTNDGKIPVRLVADARRLSFEVTARGERKAARCELPADMQLADDAASALVLPPGRSYVERFEPVLYCIGGRGLEALMPGAMVVAHLGWTGRAARSYVVAPIDGIEPVVAARKSLDAAPIALPDDPTPPEAAATASAPDDAERRKLTLRGQLAVDAASRNRLYVTVTLRNEGKRPVTLRFRPETLRFDVTGPSGTEACRWPVPMAAPMRDLFTTVRAGGSESTTVLLSEYCGSRTFDHPGLLVVHPQLDTRHASGAELALPTFDGVVTAASPTYARLHEGIAAPLLRRPRLEPIETTGAGGP